MNELLDVRPAMVAAIKAALSTLKTVETHRGRFDSVAEIKRYAMRAPAVLVTCTGFESPAQSGGELRLKAGFAWFVITRDAPNNPRDDQSLVLSHALADLIVEADWGLDYALAPGPVRADNLYSGSIDQQGVGLWGLRFSQTFAIDRLDADGYAALAPFLTFHQDVDMAPTDGQIDITETDTLPQ